MKVPATATESAVGSRNSKRTGTGLGTVDELSRVLEVGDNKERVACFMVDRAEGVPRIRWVMDPPDATENAVPLRTSPLAATLP